MYLYQQSWTLLCFMVYCMITHTCRRWLLEVSCILPCFLKVMTNKWTLTSSKGSSSMTSSYEASSSPLIIFALSVILRSLIILLLHIIVLRWHCTLLCGIILLFPLKLLHIVLWLCFKLLWKIILWLLHIVIWQLLCKLSWYMFSLHPICIWNPFGHHL
jgi:hypothetical protein